MSTLLLAESNAEIRKRLRLILADYRVTLATDGAAALEKIKAAGPDLVILDVAMPKMSGLEVLRKLREGGSDLPVVLMTGRKGSAKKALLSGADGFVLKPVQPKELLLRVRSLLGKSHLVGTPKALRVTLPALHDQRTGRLHAKRIADYLGVSLKELAGALGVNYTTVHKTPHSAALQTGLQPIKRCLEILATMITDQATVRAWLNSPHPDLGMRTPMDVILNGRVGALCTILENAFAGTPT